VHDAAAAGHQERAIGLTCFRNEGNTFMNTRTRRIAIVCQPWDTVRSESVNSIVTISYQLARCLARDWHVTIYGRRKSGQKRWEFDGGSIEFKRFRVLRKPQELMEKLISFMACYTERHVTYMLSIWYHLFYALRVAISIRSSKYDVVHVHNFLQFALLVKFFNPATTICLHTNCGWLRQFATERRLRKIDLLIGASDYITEGIKARFPAIADRCHTVYNAVDSSHFSPSSSQIEGQQRLLFLARVSPEKGVHVLIEAFKILADSRSPGFTGSSLYLDIVGDTELPPYMYLLPEPEDPVIASLRPFYGRRLSEMVRRQLTLKGQTSYWDDLVAAAGGDDRIVFHGAVFHAETIDLYRRAAVMVIPSVWNEPSPLTAYEAAACGLAVVATRSGGIPEIVEHGKTGILVARGDAKELAMAISQVIDNPALARAMGEAGRRRMLERFTWEASARHLADLIESVSGHLATKAISLSARS
jgi:glycosyltransferase involved in cell wall biosynthesis